jgi:hypothetical protein
MPPRRESLRPAAGQQRRARILQFERHKRTTLLPLERLRECLSYSCVCGGRGARFVWQKSRIVIAHLT